jgi:hypothetical protein
VCASLTGDGCSSRIISCSQGHQCTSISGHVKCSSYDRGWPCCKQYPLFLTLIIISSKAYPALLCRILGMVDGCVLVVDVTEGPMAQTRFVLSKALAKGLHPLVVFNKIDRPTASPDRCDLVHSELFDLFSALGAVDSQLDFPVIYASGAIAPRPHPVQLAEYDIQKIDPTMDEYWACFLPRYVAVWRMWRTHLHASLRVGWHAEAGANSILASLVIVHRAIIMRGNATITMHMTHPLQTPRVSAQFIGHEHYPGQGSCSAQAKQPRPHDLLSLSSSGTSAGREGWATTEYPDKDGGTDISPLLDAIVDRVPPPHGAQDAPFSMLVTMVEHDNYLGCIATGRVATGSTREGDPAKLLPLSSRPPETGKITRILKRSGASASHTQPAAHTGDIVSISGLGSVLIGDTICAPTVMDCLEPGTIDPPTLAMEFCPNSSPIGRMTGNIVTAQKIVERLQAEAAKSVSLRVRSVSPPNPHVSDTCLLPLCERAGLRRVPGHRAGRAEGVRHSAPPLPPIAHPPAP